MNHLISLLISSSTLCLSAFGCSDQSVIDADDASADTTETAEHTSNGSNDTNTDRLDASTGNGTGAATDTSSSDTGTAAADANTAAGSTAETSGTTVANDGGSELEPVNLGQAINYVILAKSAVSATGATAIVGDVGLSPADATYITGFALEAPPTTFSTSDLVTGKIWAPDYDAPTPVELTTAVLDMEAAYTDAAGRTLPDYTELGAGNIDGMTLSPGLYKWGTAVTVPNDVTLEGTSSDVWIFQVGQDLLLGNGASVTLTGDARPENIFWQVAGQATLGTTSSFQGILLSQTLIELKTGATMTGRAFAQTAVTLDATVLTAP